MNRQPLCNLFFVIWTFIFVAGCDSSYESANEKSAEKIAILLRHFEAEHNRLPSTLDELETSGVVEAGTLELLRHIPSDDSDWLYKPNESGMEKSILVSSPNGASPRIFIDSNFQVLVEEKR